MKTTEEYIEELKNSTKSELRKLIRLIQQETIQETLQFVADNIEADWEPMGWLADQHMIYEFKEGEDYEVAISRNSILELENELLKRL